MTVALFGHRDADSNAAQVLESTLSQLIRKHTQIDCLIGHHGQFDKFARSTIRKLQKEFASITYTIVLSHVSTGQIDDQTIYPEQVARVPPRFSVIERNRWMIDHSDLVVLYLKYSPSNITYCKQYAEQKHKPILFL